MLDFGNLMTATPKNVHGFFSFQLETFGSRVGILKQSNTKYLYTWEIKV